MFVLGIDDAGRGPVLGPMVLAGCVLDDSSYEFWRELGVKDSKQISPKKREELVKMIIEQARAYHIETTFPSEIDYSLRNGLNLNELEAVKAAAIINSLNVGPLRMEKIKVVIDCPSTNTLAWKESVAKRINNIDNLTLFCEHRADINHVACSAGSIIAKTTRDAEIEKIKNKLGFDIGSGYPSDPTTKKFLKEHLEEFRGKGVFRETWQTFLEAGQKGLFEFGEK